MSNLGEEFIPHSKLTSDITVAILDGPVDRAHPAFAGVDWGIAATHLPQRVVGSLALRHGTQVASIIFGHPDGPVPGLAPGCRGVSIPVFATADDGSVRPCSQLDLAHAIGLAVAAGAQVINVSGGELTPGGAAHPLLEEAVRSCARSGVLIVAAAGNDGCECLHVPAALDAVLAVGAADDQGEPLPFSNWGGPYQLRGLLAPGKDILVAEPGGRTARVSGTSYATAVASGAVARLLGVLHERGERPDPFRVRDVLLRTAKTCDQQPAADCRRVLAGRLDVTEALAALTRGTITMSEIAQDQPAGTAGPPPAAPPVAGAPSPAPARVQPAACGGGCGCGGGGGVPPVPQLVYVLGRLGYDPVSEARTDSLAQKMAAAAGRGAVPDRARVYDPSVLLEYLGAYPWDAAAVEWTLSIEGTVVYAVRPQGPFAGDAYKELKQFLNDQRTEGVERVSIPGVVAGRARLMNGQEVPVVVPEIRGMYSWTTKALAEAVAGPAPAADAPAKQRDAYGKKMAALHGFLDRVYHGLRNLGVAPQDRAVNYAATNAFAAGQVFDAAHGENMELDSINVTRSPVSRPGSDCWDVELYFFYPDRQVQTVRKVFRVTVDVSDVVPVTIGTTRSWFTR